MLKLWNINLDPQYTDTRGTLHSGQRITSLNVEWIKHHSCSRLQTMALQFLSGAALAMLAPSLRHGEGTS